MQNKGLLLLFAVIAYAVAAPARFENKAISEAAATQSETANLILDIAGKVLDFARNNIQQPSSQLANLEGAYNDETTQIEGLSNALQSFKQYLSNLAPSGGLLNLLKQLLTTLNSGSNSEDLSKLLNILFQLLTTQNPSTSALNERQVEAEVEKLYSNRGKHLTEEEVAEIEGFRNFLSNTLRLVDNKLKPSSRTPQEDDDAVSNPRKWTDLGRNLIRVLREKVNQPNGGRQG